MNRILFDPVQVWNRVHGTFFGIEKFNFTRNSICKANLCERLCKRLHSSMLENLNGCIHQRLKLWADKLVFRPAMLMSVSCEGPLWLWNFFPLKMTPTMCVIYDVVRLTVETVEPVHRLGMPVQCKLHSNDASWRTTHRSLCKTRRQCRRGRKWRAIVEFGRATQGGACPAGNPDFRGTLEKGFASVWWVTTGSCSKMAVLVLSALLPLIRHGIACMSGGGGGCCPSRSSCAPPARPCGPPPRFVLLL